MYIKIYNALGTTYLTDFTEKIRSAPGDDVFEGLTFDTCIPGGETNASFTVTRPITQWYEDLQYRNRVYISADGERNIFTGYIDKVSRGINPDTFSVEVLGMGSRLNDLGATADITVAGGTKKASDFITNVMLVDIAANSNSEIIAGTIATNDFEYDVGNLIEFAPFTEYSNCLEKLNEGNFWNWVVWGNKLYWQEPDTTNINYYVYTKDCSDLTISPAPENVCNYVIGAYSPDGVTESTVIKEDAASQALYGLIKKQLDITGQVTPTKAGDITQSYLDECKTLKVAAEFTCNKILNSEFNECPLWDVKAGDNVCLFDWLPTEETLTGVSDIATFKIKSTSYDHDGSELKIVPTEFVPSVERELSRLGLKQQF